jgi:hypothetical protein
MFAANGLDLTVYRAPEGVFVVNWASGASGTSDNPSPLGSFVRFLATQPRDVVETRDALVCGIDFVTAQLAVSEVHVTQYHWRGAEFRINRQHPGRILFRAAWRFRGWFDYKPGFGVSRFTIGARTYEFQSGRPLLSDCR